MSLPLGQPYFTPDYFASVEAAAVAASAPRPRTERFKFLTLEEAESMPPPSWLIRNVLPKGAGAELYGPSGVGKSFVALDIGMSVAANRDFLGHEVVHSGVIYCIGESAAGIGRRLKAWRAARGVSFGIRFRLLPDSVRLLDAGDVGAFLAAVRQLDESPGLIVVDTLARSIVGGEENSARDMGLAAEQIERIKRETGACVLVIHHTGKSGESERGSSAIRAAFDTMIELKNDGGVLTLRCEKQRDAEEFGSVAFVLAKQGDSLVVQRPGAAPAHHGPSKASLELLLVLARDFAVGNPTTTQWRDAAPNQFRVKGSFARWQSELVRLQLVGIDNATRWPRFSVTPDGHRALVDAGLSPLSQASSHGSDETGSKPGGGGSSHDSETPRQVATATSPEIVSSSPLSPASHAMDETENDLWEQVEERESIRDEGTN